MPNLITLEGQAFVNCKAIDVYVPKLTKLPSYAFATMQYLINVEIGSIGNGVNNIGGTNIFNNDKQSGLTISAYCTGNFADSLLNAIRNGATNATIIIKASEDTTYNDVAYAAGEVMITSTVEEATT